MGNAETDEELLARVTRGETLALQRLYDRHSPLLFTVALRILRVESEAEDLLHDAFIAIWQRSAQFSVARGSVIGWFVTLTRNLSVDRVRRRKRHHRLDQANLAHDPAPAQPTPETLYGQASLRPKILAALETLPEGSRVALSLAFFEGLSYPEIAERQGVPVATIKSRAARGIQVLRQLLATEKL